MEAAPAQSPIVRSSIIAVLLASVLFLLPGYARAASLFVVPSAKNVTVGEIFTLTIDVSSVDKAMNAASGDILFPLTNFKHFPFPKRTR